MIRINLLHGDKKKVKKAGGSNSSLGAMFVLVLVLELMGLYYWGQVKSSALEEHQRALSQMDKELKEVAELKKQQEELQTKIDEQETQNQIFERLKNGRVGGANLLLYLSYMLTKPSLESREERVVQEQLGWTTGWDTERAWFNGIKNSGKGSIVISGEALTHRDTDEVLKRLRACIYLQHLRLVVSIKKVNREGSPETIAFRFEAVLNYDPNVGKEPAEGEGDGGASSTAPTGRG
jgi:hypothetical protein